MWKSIVWSSLAALVLSGSVAVAATKQGTPLPAKPRTAESLACSKQADAKGLHGKPRKHFRSQCMRQMHKKTTG